ncbi:hypothetical protein Tco_1156123 [Tanacetum coccineum]
MVGHHHTRNTNDLHKAPNLRDIELNELSFIYVWCQLVSEQERLKRVEKPQRTRVESPQESGGERFYYDEEENPFHSNRDSEYIDEEAQHQNQNHRNNRYRRPLDLKANIPVFEVSLSEIRLDTPYGDKWIRRIGVNFLGVRDKIKSIKIITINHIKCVSLTDEQLCIRRIGCSGYAGSGIDHYAFLVLSWR